MGSQKEDSKFCGAGVERSRTLLREDRTDRNGGGERGVETLFERRASSQLTQVDVRSLPSLPLESRKSFPKKVPVIYFAFSESDEVLYIGRSVDFYTRWNGQTHHHYKRLEEVGNVRIAWLEVSDRALLPSIEYALIEHFAPPFNACNNAFSSRKGDGEATKEKTYKIRFSNWEWQRLENVAKERNVPVAQLIREGLAVTLNEEKSPA